MRDVLKENNTKTFVQKKFIEKNLALMRGFYFGSDCPVPSIFAYHIDLFNDFPLLVVFVLDFSEFSEFSKMKNMLKLYKTDIRNI